MSTLTVKKSRAIKLFEAMGLKTAKKWDLKKLTEKINEIQSPPDEPLEDEDLDALLDELMESEEATVVDDDDADEDDDEKEDDGEEAESDDDDDDTDADDSDSDDDDDEEEDGDKDSDSDGDDDEDEKPKKKADKKSKKSEKKFDKDKKEKKPKKERGESIDAVTVALLKAEPMSLEKLHKALMKKFPDHDSETLLRTTKRRLTGHLQSKGFKVHKDDKGKYSIGSKKKE